MTTTLLLLFFTCQRLYVSTGAELAYENNIFHYSRERIDEFKTGIYPYRYPFHSIDDVCSTIGFSLKERYGKTTINLHLTGHQYVMNGEKSYILLHVNVWRRIFGNTSLQIGFKYIPSYLVRYMAGDNSHYLPCDYEQSIIQAKARYHFGRLALTTNLERQFDDYKENFDYYDTEALRLGLRVGFKSVSGFSPSLSYRFKTASAREKEPDISHKEHRLSVKVREEIGNSDFDISYTFSRRNYTTDVDLSHSDRVDREHTLAIGVKILIGDRIYVSAGYLARRKCVSSPFVLGIDEEKDYVLHAVTIGFNVRYR